MDEALIIRMATPADAPTLIDIYRPYVLETAVTFELEPPTEADFAGRIQRTLERYPYLIAERGDLVVGYAYASAFRPRSAYQHAAETSIYVRRDSKGGGVGRRLYESLATLLRLQNIYNMEACIAHSDPPDEYVPAASRLFHTKLGFSVAGTFHSCAYKFGRWYDMIWMERILADHPAKPEPFAPFPSVDKALMEEAFAQINSKA